MAKNWKLYALHILDCIRKINEITKRGDISEDFILYDATLRNLQTLAESVMHFPEDLKNQHANINWKGIYGLRNILVHDYLGDIDAKTVLIIIKNYLPDLEATIREILK